MGEACYPDSLVERLCEAWKPPHRKPLGGEPSGVAFPEAVVREVVDHVFFASLRAEEGRYLRQGVVLVPDVDELRQVHHRWDLMVLGSKVDFSAAALAKLAPALAPECYAIVASAPDRLRIVGLGKPHDGHWLVAEDRYPRVRCLGPGDLVFLRGGSALLRYRAGEVSTPEGDYFQAAGEPATTMVEMTDRLFEHRDGAVDQQDRDAVRRALAEIMDAVAAAGHGALLAILAGDDPDLVPLLDACDYRIAPIDVGDALVDEYKSGLVMAQLEQEMMGPGPDYLPFRAPTKEELR